MEQYLRELYCSRIIAGYLRYTKEFRIYWPDKDTLYEACELYKEVYEESRDQGLLTAKELENHLSFSGLWQPEKNLELKLLHEELDALKIRAFHSIETAEFKSVKSRIEQVKGRIHILLLQKHKYDHITCEGVATFSKWTWILENSVYRDGQRVSAEELHVFSLLDFWNSTRMSDEQIREIARTEPWQTYWQAKTSQLFGMPDCELNDEQRRLIVWSKMYDSIRESMDAPTENVIQDDDALDGWMLVQKKKREKDRRAEQVESSIKSDRIRNSQDVMIKTWNQEDAEKITELNDEQGNMFRKMRVGQIKKSGSLEAKDMADLKIRKLER